MNERIKDEKKKEMKKEKKFMILSIWILNKRLEILKEKER